MLEYSDQTWLVSVAARYHFTVLGSVEDESSNFSHGFGAITCLLLQVPVAQAERVKDLASVRGVRSNQLIGYGLVIGLAGTGDTNTTTFTTQSIIAMLARNNVRVGVQGLRLANVAAVMAAELPPFSRVGNRIDVTVSSIGDAQSLVGGTGRPSQKP